MPVKAIALAILGTIGNLVALGSLLTLIALLALD